MNLRILMVASVMATGVASGAVAQSAGMYELHSWATSTCPAMDWHVTLDPTATGNNVSGIMQHIARIAGRINPNTRFFEMTATEVGGESRTAKQAVSASAFLGSSAPRSMLELDFSSPSANGLMLRDS